MTDAINNLVNEHEVISNKLQKTAELFEDVIKKNESSSVIIEEIEFFKKYADALHHHKEEEILFPAMVRKNDILGQGVISEMLTNHEDFRLMLSEILFLVSENKIDEAFIKFNGYREALMDHIAVENDEVFHIAESLLSEEELENIYFRFKDIEAEHNV